MEWVGGEGVDGRGWRKEREGDRGRGVDGRWREGMGGRVYNFWSQNRHANGQPYSS